MPLKNGLETVLELKEFYKKCAKAYDRELVQDLFIEEPIYVFISAHNNNKQFQEFCLSKGVDRLIEKPLQGFALKQLGKLVC
jgi:CheY-like chemotaxis protein